MRARVRDSGSHDVPTHPARHPAKRLPCPSSARGSESDGQPLLPRASLLTPAELVPILLTPQATMARRLAMEETARGACAGSSGDESDEEGGAQAQAQAEHAHR